MRLFIRIKDEVPFEHPILESNFIQAFPEVDIDNLPPEFVEFIRIEKPELGTYGTHISTTYELVDGMYTDKHVVHEMTPAEKIKKDELIQARRTTYRKEFLAAWDRKDQISNWDAFTFDETDLIFVPPVPRPDDDEIYRWSGRDNKWREEPEYPSDGAAYTFDFTQWIWVELPEGKTWKDVMTYPEWHFFNKVTNFPPPHD